MRSALAQVPALARRMCYLGAAGQSCGWARRMGGRAAVHDVLGEPLDQVVREGNVVVLRRRITIDGRDLGRHNGPSHNRQIS